MFEIRIICDPSETERVTTALAKSFTTGSVRRAPSRTSDKERLYVTAEHREDAEDWPTAEQAYALAPSIVSEIGWTARAAAEKPFGETLGREFWLRKAALLDRIALDDATASVYTDAPELALNAARKLLDVDRDGDGNYGGTPYWPDHPETLAHPRGYVRQEYALWAKHR
ncbi:hypothetical protein [Streptomyces sp. NPDC057426]|uniref:hypothetical protein n=1 Tax=Streptomyces sp. NPDC057426 TaxID=3346128 RepID=UPI0036B3D91D